LGGRGRGRWISEFKASLVYRVSSRTARATQRNPVSKNKNKTKQNKKPKKKNQKKSYLVDVFES
jgi:Sec-independent protein translocase protein TatA